MSTSASTPVLDLVTRFEAAAAEADSLRTERSRLIVAFHDRGDRSDPVATQRFRDLTQAYYVAQARADALGAALKALAGDK